MACECGEEEYLLGRCKRHHDVAWHRSRGRHWVMDPYEIDWRKVPCATCSGKGYTNSRRCTKCQGWGKHYPATLGSPSRSHRAGTTRRLETPSWPNSWAFDHVEEVVEQGRHRYVRAPVLLEDFVRRHRLDHVPSDRLGRLRAYETPATGPWVDPWYADAVRTGWFLADFLGDPRWSVNPFLNLWDRAERFGSDELEENEFRRVRRNRFIRWYLGLPRSWTTSGPEIGVRGDRYLHPLVFQPLFVSGSYPDGKRVDPWFRSCRDCQSDGLVVVDADDPIRPWQQSWRLCEKHSAAERRHSTRPRSHAPCAACGYRHDRRKGGALDEACYQEWRRARKAGMGWARFAQLRATRERARRILMSLECESASGDISPAWRRYLERAIGRNHNDVVKLVLESASGTVVPLGRPITVPAPSHNGSARAASFASPPCLNAHVPEGNAI
jgi:hypothetical protein